MKTKHILTALALPTMFAACTADDIEGLNNGMQQMPERALLSENFVLNIDNGVESRYQVNGTTGLDFVFEANDSIGANLIDAPVVGEDDPANWTIVDYVAPALPFVNAGGDAWKSAGRLGVGNYLFTNPYNPADGGRLAAKVELPRVVKYSSENPNAVIEQYNKAVAADVIYENETSANISLKNIYAYPKVRIHFANAEDVTKVTKVVLATEKTQEGSTTKVPGDGFIYKTGLDHKYISYMFDSKNIETFLENKANADKTEADYWAQFQTSHFILDGVDGLNEAKTAQVTSTTTAENYGKMEKTPYLIYEMNESVVSFGKSKGVEVRLMLPSTDNFANYDVVVYVCTDNGNYKFDFNGSATGDIQFSDTTVPAKKAKALMRNTSNTLNTVQLTTVAHGTSASLDFGNVVSNVEDWNNLVAKYGDLEKHNGKVAEHTPLAVTILNSEFAFTADAEMPEVAIFTIDKAVKVEGNVTLKNVRVTNTVEVKAGATLTTDPTFAATAVNVKEDGALVFAAQINEETKKLVEYTGVTTVNNEGTVTVPAGVIAKFALNNEETGILNVGAASRAAEDATAVLNGGYNYGIINNNSVIDVTAAFENKAASTAAKNVDEEAEYGYVFIPTIQNDGTFNSKNITTNSGLFINAGTLTSNFTSSSSFDNAGILEVKETANTYIDDNTDAKIYFEKKSTASFNIYNHNEGADYADPERGEIILKVSGKSTKLDLSASPVNVVIVDGDLEIEKTFTYTTTGTTPTSVVEGLKEVKFIGDGTLKVPAYTLAADNTTKVYTAKVGQLTVAEGVKVTVAGEINAIETKIAIANDAVLEIPAAAKLTINYAKFDLAAAVAGEKEAGKVQVGGTLIVPDKTGAAETGIISSLAGIDLLKEGVLKGETGSSTTPEQVKTAAVKAAMKSLVDAFFASHSYIGDSYKSWADVPAQKVIAAYHADYLNIAWIGNAVDAFVEVYNEIDGVTDIVAANVYELMNTYKAQVTELIAEAKTASDASLNATISTKIGNSWVGNTVYTKTSSSQLYKNIAGGTLHTAWVDAVDDITKAQIGGAAWLSLQDKIDALTEATTLSFYEGILNAKSYIPVYTGTDEYAVVEAYVKMLMDETVQDTEDAEATSLAESFADVAVYLSNLYSLAAADDAEYYFNKNVTAVVTTTILDNAKLFEAYTPEQFKALYDVVAAAHNFTFTSPQP